ncbi:5-amino-6-(D-ribitylamino)uracil--L-tyrosine 4-hydroxyphenyl transferase CofH [Bradyrhizobium sp. CSA207]|nr:5-amino-6-(D-ribitylamino)uracil--L-tyrosine 4-hydroxyphenyl transferase CofH [Bradyrhizobium sp. CSA207]
MSVVGGETLSPELLASLSEEKLSDLLEAASFIRDAGFGDVTTYSRKVFIPLTELCRDVCHYCTFAKAPKRLDTPYMSIDGVLALAERGRAAGCNEALFTLGEKPELRYRVAREWLEREGFASTVEYLAHAAGVVLRKTGLLPHINAGTLTAGELRSLRSVSASMGIMLESASDRLTAHGMVHHGSPDKIPAARLGTIRAAGELKIPTTSGILVGIGETMRERVEALVALRELHREYGHLQEVIVQNFRAKPGTRMANHCEVSADEFRRTIAIARLTLGASISIQAPPNLSPGMLRLLIEAGINDWGGVSPVTPDLVNPEAPWPHIEELERKTADAGKRLVQRLTVYPSYVADRSRWIDKAVAPRVLERADAEWLARECEWRAGGVRPPPDTPKAGARRSSNVSESVRAIVARGLDGERLETSAIVRLFACRGDEYAFVCESADQLRRHVNGGVVSYVVTRNINYTNVCTYGCKFCAFSKGKTHEDLRGKPYDLTLAEISRRAREAWARGATEVCLQGGINPDYTGRTYLDICRAVRDATPEMHIHAFSPLEVTQGAATLDIPLRDYLGQLRDAGLGSLPGTAAEILDDEVRAALCPDKLTTSQWLNVLETAHSVGLRTTSTIMYGHIEGTEHWARHLLHLRDLQARTGGITEFVPLPFVSQEAPIYLKGGARPGPTFREAILMHAVARIALHPFITNIQASWVKLGPTGVRLALSAGVNDLGGTLMNESITRAAGAVHGQEAPPETIEEWIASAGRQVRQRTTTYGEAPAAQRTASYGAPPLGELQNTSFKRVGQAATA